MGKNRKKGGKQSGDTPSNPNKQQGTTPNARNPSVRPNQQSSNGQQGTPNPTNVQPTVERGNLPQNGGTATSTNSNGRKEVQPGTSKTNPPQAKRNSPKKEPQQRNDFPAIGGLSLKESSQNGAQKNQQNAATPQSSGGKRSKSKRVSQDPQNEEQNGNQANQQNRSQLNEPSIGSPWGTQKSIISQGSESQPPTNGGARGKTSESAIDSKGPQKSAWGAIEKTVSQGTAWGAQATPEIKSNEVKSHNGTPTTSLSSAQERPRGPPIKAAEPSTCKMGSTSTSSSNTSIPLKCADAEKAEISIPKLDSVTKKKKFFPQEVFVNYLPVSLEKLPKKVHHYDFQIIPVKQESVTDEISGATLKKFPKKMCQEVFKAIMGKHYQKHAKKVAFDGVSSFYALNDSLAGEHNYNDKFNVSINYSKEINMEHIKLFAETGSKQNTDINALAKVSQEVIQCLDVVLRMAGDKTEFIRFKRSAFMHEGKKNIKGGNYEILVGLFQSLILGSRPYLNVDISHKAFPIPIELTKLYAEKSKYKYPLDEMLEGVNLIYNSPIANRELICKFNSIEGPANKEKFIDKKDNNKPKTVAEYFVYKIGKGFKYPGNPVCLVGRSGVNILIPIEFLKVAKDQTINSAPTFCTHEMVSFAATSTDDRKNKIIKLVNQMNYNNCDAINAFGITIGKSFTSVNSHILKDRQIMYKSGCANVYNGKWSIKGKGNYAIPAKVVEFGVLNLNSNEKSRNAIKNFVKAMTSSSQTYGINFETDFELIKIHGCQGIPNDLENIMCKFKTDGVKLLFVIIPNDTKVYQKVKQVAELRCGILTQCIKIDTIYRKGNDPATIDNILLKVNAKLGGTNHRVADDTEMKVESLKGPWMVVGADVTHPSPQETTIPSVVGVAASWDKFCFKYNCEWRLQNPKDEMIRDLENVMDSLLKKFKKANKGLLPKNILYYRDGVSDGQFKEVAQVELCAIQKACKRLQMTERKVTFIVVQKRHHTRFFPTQPNTMDKKNNNVVPGTVVDSVIVNPLMETFFMVSHQSIQGVAKPTKYCVLHDDAKIPSEELQVFTYGLCHMFARCNRVVSYPAPTYYAHLVAFRGRVYIHGKPINLGNLEHEYNRCRIHQDVINNNPMFFV